MPTTIQDMEFFTQSEVAEGLGVDRTTLWRWRKDGKIPPGRRFRGSQVLYTELEIQQIREYANRLEPIARDDDPHQTKLFDEGGSLR